MIPKILVIMTVVASITDLSRGSPHHHDDDRIIRLLKEARKQRRHGGGSFGREESFLGSAQVPQYQFPESAPRPGSGSSNGGGNGGSGSPPNPILTPGSSNGGNNGNFGTVGGSISGLLPAAGGGSSNYPPILPNFPSGNQFPTVPPYPIEQVNRGVSTILNGVRSLDLGQILRGAFIFPRNENVRSVANNVLDSIFGATKPAGGARI